MAEVLEGELHRLGVREGRRDTIGSAGIEIVTRLSDVDATYAALTATDVEFESEPADMPWDARHAWLSDVDGYRLSIYIPLRGAAVTKTTTKVVAGVAVAALAAAGVAAVVNHRRGHKPDPDQRAYLDELDARLKVAEEPGSDTPPGRIGRILASLQRNQGISVGRLRRWITGVRQGTLTPEQATVAESDFGALEREADQGGV